MLKSSGKIRLLTALGLMTFLLLAAAVWVWHWVKTAGEVPLALEAPVSLRVAPGSSFEDLMTQLQDLEVLAQPLRFRLQVQKARASTRIRAGEYRLQPGMNQADLLRLLLEGKVVMHRLTLVEGQRLQDYLVQLQAHEALVDDLKTDSPEAVAELLGLEGHPEGWVYPDTYFFPRGTPVTLVLRQAYRRMQEVLAEEWAERQPDTPLQTAYEALILASIVEKETGLATERARIAGVFIRRLQRGMRLQTDPTVIYGLGEAYDGNLTRDDLRRKTAWNTYRIDGLPPTPIASPARAAIHAVLHPQPGESLYFVARGDGSHQFSRTLKEHNRAVQRFQRRQRAADYRSAPPDASAAEPEPSTEGGS